MKFTLTNFNIIKINGIIGHYDDIKHQDKNEFEEWNESRKKLEKVHKFKKFGVTLTVTPKTRQSYIVSSDDHEMGEFKGQRVDIIPFLKDEKLFYLIRDCRSICVDLEYEFDHYYTYKDAASIIKRKIRDPYEVIDNERIFVPIKFSCNGSKDKLEEKFIISKRFNYSKDIEWETD